jgi:hypothetical protein
MLLWEHVAKMWEVVCATRAQLLDSDSARASHVSSLGFQSIPAMHGTRAQTFALGIGLHDGHVADAWPHPHHSWELCGIGSATVYTPLKEIVCLRNSIK